MSEQIIKIEFRGHELTFDPAGHWLFQLRRYWLSDSGRSLYLRASFRRPDGTQGSVSFHREFIGAPAELIVDHINGDTLDNRLSNLRLCNYRQNGHNRKKNKGAASQYKGVCRVATNWKAQIKTPEGMRSLGSYTNERDAALAYDAAARKHFGEFARPNFPTE